MSARPNLQIWAVARGDEVLTMGLLCLEHAGWSRDPDFEQVPGVTIFRVRAKAIVREMLRGGGGCVECAARGGKSLLAWRGPKLGELRRSHLAQEGGEA